MLKKKKKNQLAEKNCGSRVGGIMYSAAGLQVCPRPNKRGPEVHGRPLARIPSAFLRCLPAPLSSSSPSHCGLSSDSIDSHPPPSPSLPLPEGRAGPRGRRLLCCRPCGPVCPRSGAYTGGSLGSPGRPRWGALFGCGHPVI